VDDVVALPVEEGVAVNEEEKVALAVAVAVPLLVAVAVAVAEGVSLVITAFRTRWEPPPSVQYTVAGVLPSTNGTKTRPMGCVREANAPLPLFWPAAPSWPTDVATTPAGVTARIAELPLSVTCQTPSALFHATPEGKLNRALLPAPSAVPDDPQAPARCVVGEPSAGTKRTQWLFASATHSGSSEFADSESATG
jgi:hypothetical protein